MANLLPQIEILTQLVAWVKSLFVQPDYAQNDSTQPDYIKNRTHYVESVSTSSVWYQTNVEVGSASSSPGAYSGTFNLTEGKTYNVTITQGSNTKTYEGIVAENNTTLNGMFLNKNWSNPMYGAETTSDAFYILVQASSVILAGADVYGSNCTVQVSEVTETIHKLDPKYLPDNVNQLEDVTTSKSGKVTTVTFEQTNGTQTQFQVTDGADGTNGKSAYQVAVDNGYSGSEAQWLASLKGADGVSLGEVELTQEVKDIYFGYLSLMKSEIDSIGSTHYDLLCFLIENLEIDNPILLLNDPFDYVAQLVYQDYNNLRAYKVIAKNIPNEMYKSFLKKRKEKIELMKKIEQKSKLINRITANTIILDRIELKKIIEKEIEDIVKDKAFSIKEWISYDVK